MHYAGDLRGLIRPLSPGQLEAIICEKLRLCETVGCCSCGHGTDSSITCSQLEHEQASNGPFSMAVSAAHGPTKDQIPSWVIVAWETRAGLHFEINLDATAPWPGIVSLWEELRTYGYLWISSTNRATGPEDHPAADQFRPRMRGAQ